MPRGYAWTDAELAVLERRMRRYAERGLSLRETAKVMEMTWATINNLNVRFRIHFRGRSGAPLGNQNGARTHFQRGNYPARWARR